MPKDSIRPDERVLIVDDIVRTGVTLTGLTGLTEQARAKTVGVFAIVLVQEARKKLKKHLGATCQILSMIEVAA
ncbi:MAG: phosphoribosyltransferase family protein [Aigarchaeota archaeon]|nr:phosphoribosyltransferase family protein [Aigarchaeota archaeon]